MIEYRCRFPHPDFPGQPCNKFLLKGDFQGEVHLPPCKRCGGMTLLRVPGRVDKELVRI